MAKLQDHVASRGADCMAGLGRAFRIVDSDNSHQLDRDEFKRALQIWGMNDENALNEAEISLLMAHFDEDGDGKISYSEFIWGIRGKMNDRRMNMVKKAYDCLDANHDGDLTLGDIMAAYDASQHPDVIAGRKSPEEVFRVFLDSFEGPHGDKDGHISHQEWTEYYENISASIDNDDYFVLMMQNAWKISEAAGEFTLDPSRAAHLEETLRSKLLQKKKDRETEARCLLSAFRHFNFGDSNTADARCFARAVEKFGVVLDEAEMDAWFTYYDQDHTGTINYEAFAAALYPEDAIQVRPTGVAVTPQGRGGGAAAPEVWRPSTRQSRPSSAHTDTRPW